VRERHVHAAPSSTPPTAWLPRVTDEPTDEQHGHRDRKHDLREQATIGGSACGECQSDDHVDPGGHEDQALDDVDEPARPPAIGPQPTTSTRITNRRRAAHHRRRTARAREEDGPHECLDSRRDQDRALEEQERSSHVEQVVGRLSSPVHRAIFERSREAPMTQHEAFMSVGSLGRLRRVARARELHRHRVPPPSAFAARIVPPWAWTIARAIAQAKAGPLAEARRVGA